MHIDNPDQYLPGEPTAELFKLRGVRWHEPRPGKTTVHFGDGWRCVIRDSHGNVTFAADAPRKRTVKSFARAFGYTGTFHKVS
jgi:hypothetical protein